MWLGRSTDPKNNTLKYVHNEEYIYLKIMQKSQPRYNIDNGISNLYFGFRVKDAKT